MASNLVYEVLCSLEKFTYRIIVYPTDFLLPGQQDQGERLPGFQHRILRLSDIFE